MARAAGYVTLAEKTWEIALGEEGTEEVPRGSNRGPVEKYLAVVHLAPGNPWCAAYVTWCVYEGTKIVGGPPIFKGSGSALGLLSANPSLILASPIPGEAFIAVKEHADHVHGHAFFAWLRDDGRLDTCEGNSNDDGSREGYEVCRLIRKPSDCLGFIRIG